MADTLTFGHGGNGTTVENKEKTISDPPYALPGFEASLIAELEGLIADLPTNTANLRIGRVPGHPELAEPYFEVTPTNPRAACFKGIVVATDLNITIGQSSFRELIGFARGGTLIEGATWQEEFRWLWYAVTKGGFTEHIYRRSDGKAIGWSTVITINGKDLIIRNGRGVARLFTRKREDSIVYDSYIP
jgi:hypothetical protein